MKRQGITKKDMAEKLGQSQPNITKKFKHNDWRESDIQKICDVIGADFEVVIKLNNEEI